MDADIFILADGYKIYSGITDSQILNVDGLKITRQCGMKKRYLPVQCIDRHPQA